MEAKDWLKGVEKKLVIAQCTSSLARQQISERHTVTPM
jgi:hypothetical protein